MNLLASKRARRFVRLLALAALCVPFASSAAEDQKMDPRIAAFVAAKRAQIETIEKDAERPVPKLVQDFFSAFAAQKWHDATNAAEHALRFAESEDAKSDPQLLQDMTRVRQPLMESLGGLELFREMNPRFFNALGQELTESIAPGSIYFGGSDEGRFLPTLFSQSQVEGRPFFTLTQNALADGSYLIYLDQIYGKKLKLPTMQDSQRCFQEYLGDVQRRREHDRKFPDDPPQMRPGEEVKIVENRVQVNGVTAVMAINGMLVKTIFDKNPDREFYIEESFPLDWMYPHLTPHRLIFKINRNPLTTLTAEMTQANRQLWSKQVDAWIGPWLRPKTPLPEVMDFIERVYKRKDLKGFKGDSEFVKDGETQKAFGRMRAAVAGLYAWHAAKMENEAERRRLNEEADFAFRQAVAIGPASPDAVGRYARRLAERGDRANALRLARLATAIDPEEEKLKPLLKQFSE